MILDEFRAAKDIYEEMLLEGKDLPGLLNVVDKKLAEISNHIAVCHRVIAESRAAANSISSILGGATKQQLQKTERAESVLEETIQLQAQFFGFRYKVLKALFK